MTRAGATNAAATAQFGNEATREPNWKCGGGTQKQIRKEKKARDRGIKARE